MNKFLVILGFLILAGGFYLFSEPVTREVASEKEDLSLMGGSGAKAPAQVGTIANLGANSLTDSAGTANSTGGAAPLGTNGSGRTPSSVSASSDALARLQQISNRPWDIRRDSFDESIRTLESGILPRMAPEQFISEFSNSLFGVPSEHLVESKREETERTKIVFEQKVNGLKVYGGTLTLFYENGALSRVQNDLVANEKLNAQPKAMAASEIIRFLEDSARLSAQARGDQVLPTVSAYKSTSAPDLGQPELMLYPGSNSLVHVYKIAVQEERKGERPKAFYAIVDAENLRIITKKEFQVE